MQRDACTTVPNVLAMGTGWAVAGALAGFKGHQRASDAMMLALDGGITTAASAGAVIVRGAFNRATPVAQTEFPHGAGLAVNRLPTIVDPGPAAASAGVALCFRHAAGASNAGLAPVARSTRAATAVLAADAVGAIGDASRWRRWRKLLLRVLVLSVFSALAPSIDVRNDEC